MEWSNSRRIRSSSEAGGSEMYPTLASPARTS